ncbi:MAG: insulinase family protein [Planctomycetes bacterium]|nr:insulinase family protein [Planctomycetota bacterium]
MRRLLPLLFLSALALPSAATAATGDPLERRELATGIRLSVLTVADAPLQTFFAFVPTGLAHDDAGRAQWSHLLEHMAIRTTDPEGLTDGEIRFNGETGDGSLRFDVHAPPAQAPLAAAKLCAWLSAFEFDPEILATEQRKIAGELGATAPRGFGHKWATAAWAQVVRHGAREVTVQGDVDRATVEAVAAHADRVLHLGQAMAIYAAGPLSAEEVARLFDGQLASGGGLDSLANALGGNPRAAKQAPPAAGAAADRALDPALAPIPRDPATGLALGEHVASWDLPRPHVLEWYLLPDVTPVDRLTAATLAGVLGMTLAQDRKLQEAGIVALASSEISLPAGRVLLFSASLPDGVDPGATAAKARIAFRSAIEGLGKAPPFRSLDEVVALTRRELEGGLPDLAVLRRQMAGRPNAELIDAQVVLGLAHREWSMRLTLPQLSAAAKQLAAPALSDFVTLRLAAPAANVVLLRPRNG